MGRCSRCVLANSYNAPVLNGNPDIDEVYAYRKLKHLGAGGEVFSALAERVGLIWMLRRKKMDLVILAAGPQDKRGAGLAKFLNAGLVLCSAPAMGGQHEVERIFTVARQLGIHGPIPPVGITPVKKAIARVREAILNAGLNARHPFIGVHISARRITQRWRAERFADLIVALCEKQGAAAMLFWSPGPENHPQHPGDDTNAKIVIDFVGRKAKLISLRVQFPAPWGVHFWSCLRF